MSSKPSLGYKIFLIAMLVLLVLPIVLQLFR
jgi:hypothetical protein